jgi:hypothetical protein
MKGPRIDSLKNIFLREKNLQKVRLTEIFFLSIFQRKKFSVSLSRGLRTPKFFSSESIRGKRNCLYSSEPSNLQKFRSGNQESYCHTQQDSFDEEDWRVCSGCPIEFDSVKILSEIHLFSELFWVFRSNPLMQNYA